ncbi:hypothetical protein [Vibrio neonatus]|uniref:hypothetical protein n=1 Tax=Vibrio neonatus TaxID=278860 RepID=UPI0021C3C5BD|nr:hypothetical protein [Vibrio neonatus]
MKFFNPTGTKKNIGLKPLSQRLATVQDKSIVFYYSWQDGSLYDGQFSDILAEMFKSAGATVTQIYKRKAFDQNDVEERKNIGKHDAVIYFGASSCSTSKFATVYGGLIDSEEQTPTVVVTYNTFKNDCIHANYENGTKTRCVYTDYPGDSLSSDAISIAFQSILEALQQQLSSTEMESGEFSFPKEPEIIEVDNDPYKWLVDNHKTDCSPVIIPTIENVEQMLTRVRA